MTLATISTNHQNAVDHAPLMKINLLRATVNNESRLKKFLREVKIPKETMSRIASETTSWRLTVLFIITPAITYGVTHKLKFAAEVSTLELVVKFPAQILHGKLWAHLPWGYKKQNMGMTKK